MSGRPSSPRNPIDLGQLAKFIALVPVPITVLDGDGMSLLVNSAYCEALGLDTEAVKTRELGDAVHPADISVADAAIARALATGEAEEDLRLRKSDGDYLSVHWDLQYEREANHIIAIASDRTSERERLAEAQLRARTDELTGLLSRLGLMESLDELHATHRDGGLVVALFDVDGFKKLNDSMGHAAGDSVLRVLSQRLRSAVPAAATVGRLGGDEFVVACPKAIMPIEDLAVAIESTFALPMRLGGGLIDIQSSTGLYESVSGDTVTDLLRNADLAVYEAKRQGRQRSCVATRELVSSWQITRNIESQLAADLGTGRFAPYFQPIVSTATGAPVAYEVLLRWLGTDGSVQPAASFLDIAERSRLLSAMSAEVREQAFAVASQRPDLHLSINASSHELLARDFTKDLFALTEINRVSPERIVVEITEQTALQNLTQAAGVLTQLRSAGFSIALDDFGSGYSSLTYLTQLPIDIVKLDRAFLRSAGTPGQGDKILRALSHFLREIELTTVLEGVETAADHQLVVDLGIEHAQGWHYGHPTAANDLPPPTDPNFVAEGEFFTHGNTNWFRSPLAT